MTTKKQRKPRRLTVKNMAHKYALTKIGNPGISEYGFGYDAYLAGYRACQRRNRKTKR